jgi:hypothetical protein
MTTLQTLRVVLGQIKIHHIMNSLPDENHNDVWYTEEARLLNEELNDKLDKLQEQYEAELEAAE